MYINYLAVFVAAIVNMIVGFVWYVPFLFGKKWLATLPQETVQKIEIGNKKNMFPTMILAFAGSLLTAYVLAVFVGVGATWTNAVVGALFIWLGFSLPSSLGLVLWEKKSWTYFFINTAYNLVVFVVMAVIIGLWS